MLPFKPFDEDGELRVYYHGFLPHWRQDGCTYFVTFRLEDSVPQAVLDEWGYERGKWLAARGISDLAEESGRRVFRNLPQQERQLFERRFAGMLHRYLDAGHGECVLRNPPAGNTVARALEFYHAGCLPSPVAVGHERGNRCGGTPQSHSGDSRVVTGDYVVMPNHVHALLTPLPGCELEHVLQAIKSYTAHQINKTLGITGKLWMKESYDHIVRDAEELVRIQGYLRENPAKANLRPEDCMLATAVYDLRGCS